MSDNQHFDSSLVIPEDNILKMDPPTQEQIKQWATYIDAIILARLDFMLKARGNDRTIPVDHYDPSTERDWDVWSEGYRCTGDRSDATFLGTFHGDWLRACQKAVAEFYGEKFETHDGNWKPSRFGHYRHAYWACELFPTEAQARASFG